MGCTLIRRSAPCLNPNGFSDPCDDALQILGSQGPVSSGTRADYVKFHDDKVSKSTREH